MVTHGMRPPSPPLVLPLSESDINNLLILRKKTPYDEEEDEIRRKAKQMFDFLAIDALEFDELDKDTLADSIKDIWVTDLDRGADYYLGELLHDMIDLLNLALADLFRDQLDTENEELFRQREYGYDETTRITLNYSQPIFHVQRNDVGMYHTIDLKLNDQYGYTINMEQQDGAVYDYMLGVGSNTIDITQRQ
jgi:hypothetical protein